MLFAPVVSGGELGAAPRFASITEPALTAMPQFAVFFSDGAGFGIEMVQALEAVQLKLSLPFGLSQAALRSRMPVLSL